MVDDFLKRRRGRPTGFKLSEESKKAISLSKFGHIHEEKTKEQISTSLLAFYKNKYPLSGEMLEAYHKKCGEDAAAWIAKNFDKLDDLVDVITERSLSNARRREYQFNGSFYKNTMELSPEKTLDLKYLLRSLGFEPKDKEVFEIIRILVEELGILFLLEDVRSILEDY